MRTATFARLLASVVPCLLLACGGGETASGTGGTGGTGAGAGGTGGSTGTVSPSCDLPDEDLAEPARHTPRWAFEPWISKDISSGADTYDFVQGFLDRDIPVGAVVLDSPWETNYNTFVPHPVRYPEFPKLVSDMHDKDVRVVLWITQMVNSVSLDFEPGGDSYDGPSPNQEEGYACNYFVNDGDEYQWWKGKGAGVDFFNPDAAAWWHAQQETVLSAGIDGWKLDFGDSYVLTDTVKTAKGDVPHQEYSEAYYRDYLAYGVHSRGEDFLTMVRAWDASYGFEGRFYARPEHAPVAWMGDNRRDWIGIADVLDSMFRSAAAGYVVVGSDIGGYLDHDDKDLLGPEIPLDPVVFMKWTALGALSPFMQLHGRANLTPWTFPEKTAEVEGVYRYWSKLHHELVPYLYSLSEEAYAGGPNMVEPIGAEAEWAGDYRYLLGGALLVAPLLDGTGVRDVELPADARWYDWWDPTGDALDGGALLPSYDATADARIPLFVKAGAILPLQVGDALTGLGTEAAKDALTVLVYPATAPSSFTLHDLDGMTTSLSASTVGDSYLLTVDRAPRDTLVRFRFDTAPTGATVDGQSVPELADRAAFDAAPAGWFLEAATRSAWVKIPAGAGAHSAAVMF